MHVLEISAFEIAIGTFSGCLPLYKPLYNRLVHGQATANASRTGPKSYRQADMKLVSVNRRWYGHQAPRRSDDEDRLYDHLDSFARVKGDEASMSQQSHHGRETTVTKELANLSSGTFPDSSQVSPKIQ